MIITDIRADQQPALSLEFSEPALWTFLDQQRNIIDALTNRVDALETRLRDLEAEVRGEPGAELAHDDHGDQALDQLNAAFDTYVHHEALADARRVGRELRRLGVQRRVVSQPRAKTRWDSLTDSEVKVVNLIAQGATNRSVAQRLHVTPHTVKAHLHNAFAKLGINSRAELSNLMDGTDQPTT